MSKRVSVHWVEMRTLEVPDECPTDKVEDFERWVYDSASNNPYTSDPYDCDEKNFVIKSGTRDFEIVDVTPMEEARVGYGEDEHQR